jgi:hypothetical protein
MTTIHTRTTDFIKDKNRSVLSNCNRKISTLYQPYNNPTDKREIEYQYKTCKYPKHKERQNVYSMHSFDMEQPKDLYFMESISHTKIFIPLGCGCHQEKMIVISTT